MFKKFKNAMNKIAGGISGLVIGPIIGMVAGGYKAIAIMLEWFARFNTSDHSLVHIALASAALLYMLVALPIGMVTGTINGLLKGVHGGLTKGVLGAVEAARNLLNLQPAFLSKDYIRSLPLAERRAFWSAMKSDFEYLTKTYREARIPFSEDEEAEFNTLAQQEEMIAAKKVAAEDLTTYATLLFKGKYQPGSESLLSSLPPEVIIPILNEAASSILSPKETDKVITASYQSVVGIYDRRRGMEKEAASETTPLLKEYELSYSR